MVKPKIIQLGSNLYAPMTGTMQNEAQIIESIGWHWVDHTDPLPGERAPYHCFIEALVGSTLQSTWVFENGVYPQTAILIWKII